MVREDRGTRWAIALALMAVHCLLAVGLAPWLGLATDFLDPVRRATRILEGEPPWAMGTAVFGWGRDASYVPLVVGVDSWVDHATRRALLQSLIPPLVFLATLRLLGERAREPGALVASVLAAAVVSFDIRLGHVVTGTHQGYTAMEWGAVFAVGLAWLATGGGRWRWLGVLAGLAAPMMAFNTPYGAAAVPVLLVGLALAWRRGDRGVVVAALGIGAVIAAPHLLTLTGDLEAAFPYGEAQDHGLSDDVGMITAMKALVGSPDTLPLSTAAAGYLSGLDDPAGVALCLGLALALAVGLRERPMGALALGLLAALPVGTALTLLVTHYKPWHVTPMIPPLAVLGGAGLARLLGRLPTRPRAVVGLLATAGVLHTVHLSVALRPALAQGAETLITAHHVDRIAARLSPPGMGAPADHREVLATLGPKDSLQPRFADIYLAAWFAHRDADRPASAAAPGRTLYAIANEECIEALSEVPLDGLFVEAGRRWVMVRPEDEEAGRRWQLAACVACDRSALHRAGPTVFDVLLYEEGLPRPLSLHPCLAPTDWLDLPETTIDAGWWAPDRAGHLETVPGFAIQAYEATHRDWADCVDDGACSPVDRGTEPTAIHAPVTGISRAEAESYCRWEGGRLPTAAEWFVAALPAERLAPAHGVVTARGGLRPAGMDPGSRSRFGVEDLVGNAPEWVQGGVLGGGPVAPGTMADSHEGAGLRCATDG